MLILAIQNHGGHFYFVRLLLNLARPCLPPGRFVTIFFNLFFFVPIFSFAPFVPLFPSCYLVTHCVTLFYFVPSYVENQGISYFFAYFSCIYLFPLKCGSQFWTGSCQGRRPSAVHFSLYRNSGRTIFVFRGKR